MQVWASITRMLGSSVWQHTIVALSHGRMKGLPADTTYGAPYMLQFGMCSLPEQSLSTSTVNPAHLANSCGARSARSGSFHRDTR